MRNFPPSRRLLKAADFRSVFAKPKRIKGRYFTVLARDNQQDKARLGLAIAKKQIRLAVARNTIKRIIRESFRHHQDILLGLDIVITAGPNANRATKSQIRASLDGQWLDLVTADQDRSNNRQR